MRAEGPGGGRGAVWQMAAVLFASTLLAGVAAYFVTALAMPGGDDEEAAATSAATTALRPAATYRVPPAEGSAAAGSAAADSAATGAAAGGGYVVLSDEARPVRFSESGVGAGGAAGGGAGGPAAGGGVATAAGGTPSGGGGASGPDPSGTAASTGAGTAADSGSGTAAGASAPSSGRGRPAVPGRGTGSVGAIVPIDPCVIGGATCPRGVLGRIIGGPAAAEPEEVPAGVDLARLLGVRWLADYLGALADATPEEAPEDVGRSSEALTAASIIRAVALITAAEVAGAADVPGCLGPSGDSASFVVGTVGRSGLTVYYWPVARSGDPLYSEVRHVDGVTTILVDRPIGGPRYEGCARMAGLRPGLIYEARARATAEDGSVEWSPIGDFCVAPCLPRFAAPDGVLTGARIEIHSSWVVAYLDAPPVGGALELFTKWPDAPDWRLSTMRTNYLAGQPLPSVGLLPTGEYEYKLVLHGDDGRTYESVPARFTTLRRTVIATASRFHVIRSGDSGTGELKSLELYINPFTAGLFCTSGPCRDTRDAGRIAVPLGGLVGDNPYDGETIDIEAGTTIGVVPRFLVYLESTSDSNFYAVTDAFETGTLEVPRGGYLFWEIRIPTHVGTLARFGGLELGSVCDVPGAAFSPTLGGAIVHIMEPSASAPWLQPADLRMCILEVP